MKKRKFVAMTNAEYLEKMGLGLCDFYHRCPWSYRLENYYKVCGPMPCIVINDCKKCWNLPAKIGRYFLKEVKK